MFIFIDIETTGLPDRISFDNYYDPEEIHHYDSSRIIQIAYLICEENGEIIKTVDKIIKCDNFTINNSDLHGITNYKANNEGVDIRDALNNLYIDMKNVDTIVSHNCSFDKNIILSECHRYNNKKLSKEINTKKTYCTMKLGKSIMNQRKYPKLCELYNFLFKDNIQPKHNAVYDAEICKLCYYKMK